MHVATRARIQVETRAETVGDSLHLGELRDSMVGEKIELTGGQAGDRRPCDRRAATNAWVNLSLKEADSAPDHDGNSAAGKPVHFISPLGSSEKSARALEKLTSIGKAFNRAFAVRPTLS